eukprot:6120176-Alexandrium_andersonii.AAC.1
MKASGLPSKAVPNVALQPSFAEYLALRGMAKGSTFMMRCFKEQLQTCVLRSSAAPAAPTEEEEIDSCPEDLGVAKYLRELWTG